MSQPSNPGSPTPGSSGGELPPTQKPRGKPVVLIAALVVLVGIGVAYSVMRLRQREVPPSEPPPPPVAVQVDAGTPPSLEPPSVPEGDAKVRALMGPLSTDPDFAKWLSVEGLLQRFTTAVSNIADGESPRMVLSFLAPVEGFQVIEAKGKTTIDPKSYERYDGVARVVGSLDLPGAGRAWLELKPLVDRVYAEIAPPGRTFEQTFTQAIQNLLAVPVPEGDVEVVPQGGLYAYADPKLEGLSRAQKHLLRMGPKNIQLIQGRLQALHSELRLTPIDR
ncbi:DUF3014 domain-containing protein [Hyalangium rubrum]|uniref:DUF3014 domain-containing protein n=1 Tax=Hyalangium rubrum TaxID=3103134 RepID=A0ABU5HDH1_9BACT|nr:DUF3014 domain-containing protein [Hyalangium sp. s54d21]MDY7231144.1 DUF3014 domain-containing protein [Hyalangium sp. s54d21]